MIWDPSDANPLHRRLPAEITSRRIRIEAKKGPTLPKELLEDIEVDLKTAVSVKPDARPKWLRKACQMTQDGKASSTELYNIINSRRFSAGLPERIGRKLSVVVEKNLTLFSDKQRRHLTSHDFHLNTVAEAAARDAERDPEDDDKKELLKEMLKRDIPQDGEDRKEGKKAMMDISRVFERAQADAATAKQREQREAQQIEAREADRKTRLVEEAASKQRRQAEVPKNVFNEAVKPAATPQQDAARKKLEDEADALLERAMNPVNKPSHEEREERHKHRRRSRSRSVSAKAASESPPSRRAAWKRDKPEKLTGSRAILMNRDFQEDLPHLPRPQGGTRGSGEPSEAHAICDAERSPERSRPRDRSRRRSRRH